MDFFQKTRWLSDDITFVCHGGGGGGGGGGGSAAADYAAAVESSLSGRGELGYPAHEGGFGGTDGGFAGGGLGGDLSSFDAFAFAPDFSVTDPNNFANPWSHTSPAFNFGVPAGFTAPGTTGFNADSAFEGLSMPSPANFGFGENFGVNPAAPDAPSPSVAGPGGPGGGGGGLAGGGPGFGGGQSGGPTGGPPGDFGMVGGPTGGVGWSGVGSSAPGLDNQLAGQGWEGFDPHGQVPGMNNLNSWRGPQGGIHPLADFIQAGWANQRLYTPDFLADTFTDVGTSPQEAYEQLAGRGHVPPPVYPGVQDLNTGGGTNRPTFPSAWPGGGMPNQMGQGGTQPFNGVQPISPNMIPPDPNSGGMPQAIDMNNPQMLAQLLGGRR